MIRTPPKPPQSLNCRNRYLALSGPEEGKVTCHLRVQTGQGKYRHKYFIICEPKRLLYSRAIFIFACIYKSRQHSQKLKCTIPKKGDTSYILLTRMYNAIVSLDVNYSLMKYVLNYKRRHSYIGSTISYINFKSVKNRHFRTFKRLSNL